MILITVTFTTKEDFLKVAKARKDVRITDIACPDPPRLEFGAHPTFGELMAENTFGEDVDMYDFDIDPDDAEAFLGMIPEVWIPSIFGTDPPFGDEPPIWMPVPNFPEKPKDWPTRATTNEVLIKQEEKE